MRYYGSEVTFAIAHDCTGQWWTEAIAVLNLAAAELRLKAQQCVREHAPGYGYGEMRETYDDLMGRAAKLDGLAHWLRDCGDLPDKPKK